MIVVLLLCILGLQGTVEGASKVLIIYAHQEPQSFCGAMKRTIEQTLLNTGHDIKTTDLYVLKMFNRLDRSDFTELSNTTYFLPQSEQIAANEKNRTTFSEELQREHNRAEWADVLLFVYPYYLSYVPGIIQSYMERVFSKGFAFGPHGDHLKDKKAMLIYTTGGTKEQIGQQEARMVYLQHRIFENLKMIPLAPFPAYSPAGVSDEIRQEYLRNLTDVMTKLDGLPNAII
jgi:NAD(P)H dehydrogenase (quinone)